jgi:hypothetical protein
MDAADLLVGPRGRRLCVALLERLAEDDDDLHHALFWSTYRLAPYPGKLFGPGADDPPPEIGVPEVATLVDDNRLARTTSADVWAALLDAVTWAAYWQPPDGADVLADGLVADGSLRRIADAVVATGATARWSDAFDASDQHVTAFADHAEDRPDDPVGTPSRSTVPLLLGEQREERREPRRGVLRDRPTSSSWWSTPSESLPMTTRRLVDGVPAGTDLVEDGYGWVRAATRTAVVPPGGRVFEIDGPAAWADLCARHPLDVSWHHALDWSETTGRKGDWVEPDWISVATEHDAVHLTISGYLTTAGRPIDVPGHGATVLAGWGPDQAYWFRELELTGPVERWWRDEDATPTPRWLPDPSA